MKNLAGITLFKLYGERQYYQPVVLLNLYHQSQKPMNFTIDGNVKYFFKSSYLGLFKNINKTIPCVIYT